jgi:hypothetical protein
MKLDDCVLDATVAVGRSPSPTAPESEWTEARDKSLIPEHLYRFYCRADYFGYDRAPRFLDDSDRMLFSFLAGLARGIRESFEEAHSLVASIRADEGKGYSPVKELNREPYDRAADIRQRRAFRHLIVSLSGALDQFAEIVSIFFHGDIEGLTVGRASFAELRGFARTPFVPAVPIVSPKEARFEQLHRVLTEELQGTGDDALWFELLHLYRNKLAHLGSPMFPIVSFHDKRGIFSSFTPNRWPLFHQTELAPAGTTTPDPRAMENYAKANYVHQNIVSYCEGLLARVSGLVERGFEVLCSTYADFKDFDLNTSALRSLKNKRQQYQFRCFR